MSRELNISLLRKHHHQLLESETSHAPQSSPSEVLVPSCTVPLLSLLLGAKRNKNPGGCLQNNAVLCTHNHRDLVRHYSSVVAALGLETLGFILSARPQVTAWPLLSPPSVPLFPSSSSAHHFDSCSLPAEDWPRKYKIAAPSRIKYDLVFTGGSKRHPMPSCPCLFLNSTLSSHCCSFRLWSSLGQLHSLQSRSVQKPRGKEAT